jgi:hypothetical protein
MLPKDKAMLKNITENHITYFYSRHEQIILLQNNTLLEIIIKGEKIRLYIDVKISCKITIGFTLCQKLIKSLHKIRMFSQQIAYLKE